MFAFFDGLVNFISTIISFIINFIAGLAQFLLMLEQSMAYIFICVGFMPPFVLVFINAIIALAIIMQIINHGS